MNNTPTPDQTELEIVLERYKEDIKFLHHRIKDQGLTPDQILAKEDLLTTKPLAAISKLIDGAELNGLRRAKEMVITRTEIPKDAKNPTRDLVVITGEECAKVINYAIQDLEAKLKKGI